MPKIESRILFEIKSRDLYLNKDPDFNGIRGVGGVIAVSNYKEMQT